MTVLVGEVVGSDLAVLPPDVETKVNELRPLDGAAQAAQVTAMLSHARTGLLVAIAAQDLPQIVEFKRKAAAIQEIAKQVRMGKEFQLDAAEFVRRAERGLGVAIREGQKCGDVRSDEENKRMAAWKARGTFEQNCTEDLLNKPQATDFATRNELHSSSGPGIFNITDGVTDEQFENAITEARSEGNLTRSNVARKAHAKERVDSDDPLIDAQVEAPKKRLTKHDSAEMLANINGMLNGIVESIPFINPAEVDFSDKNSRRVIENIRESMARVRKLLKEIENG